MDRVDQDELPLNNLFYNEYDQSLGFDSVDVYILDTGIHNNHSAFNKYGVASEYYVSTDETSAPDITYFNGHGTAMAGLIGGEFGVSPGAKIHAIRIFDQDEFASYALFVAAINRVINQVGITARKSVVNISIGSVWDENDNATYLAYLKSTVQGLITAGIPTAVAGGNWQHDACLNFPAMVPEVISVGGSNIDDQLYIYSSYGSCIDVVAPAVSITAPCYYYGWTTCTWPGTSMSTAMTTGAMAAYWHTNPNKTAAEVMAWVTSGATQGVLNGQLLGTPNRLLRTVGCSS
ncbi:unnamed protein product [Owenia fusiformis]|uniref:Peptidase S8/S53 domain-containing protein n=1 Tax=Owenia fusiformis TaxID=6347 RepID=A0A8S4MYM5_OWEFU|nr:unnamed protein product [Owenia fusiformis]